ncbi:MAG TPA: hypothetical protein VFF03_07510 [Rhodocyclaceae bacterium]|nr:hypothetical protein [Rhodocyclaceae bacterium]
MRHLIALISLAALAGSALAQSTIVPKLDQEGRKGDMARMAKEKAVEKFDTLDANKDGKLSREELAESAPYMAENFQRYDKNNDGFLSWEEYVGHNRWPK